MNLADNLAQAACLRSTSHSSVPLLLEASLRLPNQQVPLLETGWVDSRCGLGFEDH